MIDGIGEKIYLLDWFCREIEDVEIKPIFSFDFPFPKRVSPPVAIGYPKPIAAYTAK
jgi:hypothetical protein